MAAVEQVLHHAGPVVFFLGQAGAGKSTHINKFSGSTLQVCQHWSRSRMGASFN
jgi:putative ribosome biogenesis GTPase RsgA